MDRKVFLHLGLSLVGHGAAARNISPWVETEEVPFSHAIMPPYLKQGDTIGVVSPAGYIEAEDVQPAVDKLNAWGFKVAIGTSIGQKEGGLGGGDVVRAADLNAMIHDDNIRAILCARGGYGLVRIIDRLDLKYLRKHPKWMIGFSDITVLLCHLWQVHKLASLHSKMCNSFPTNWEAASQEQRNSIDSILHALKGEDKMNYTFRSDPHNRRGTANGVLIGGNLRTIENLAGSRSYPDGKNKILFLEDTSEYLYNIDRMFWNLQRSGMLASLSGLIIGNFGVKPNEDASEEFPLSLTDIVLEKVRSYDFPVCFGFPVGHQKANYALKCGVRHALMVGADSVILKEL